MNADEVVWEDPPEDGRGGPGRWAERLAPLREHPGRWARVGQECSPEISTRIRLGRVRGVTRGDFEVVTRRAGLNYEKGRVDVYARFIGKGDPS